MNRPLTYRSVCSGIEAASVAWSQLGWQALSFSEIEPFPCSVLSHRFPGVPNLGNMNDYQGWPDATTDLLVGGTPCQSFSVAGLRQGLKDPRGNLALVFLGLVERYQPTWFVWENVPGVLSSSNGRDFGSFLGAVAQLGYGFAYRILDAQFLGVPQRRRRVFVVGHIRDWRLAAAVLFERESLRGNLAKGSKKRTGVAALTANGVGTCGADDNQAQAGHLIAHTLRGTGFDASEDRTGRGIPLVPIAFDCKASGQGGFGVGEIASTMRAMGHAGSHQNGGGHLAVACFKGGQGASAGGIGYSEHVAPTLSASPSGTQQSPTLMQGLAVRRLTPRECERLQGFPDDWTDVPHRCKPARDGPRYKAIGNSMAVPVMSWIGERLNNVHKEIQE